MRQDKARSGLSTEEEQQSKPEKIRGWMQAYKLNGIEREALCHA